MHLFYFLGLKQWKVMSILSGECKKNFTSLVFASLFCFFLCFNLDFVWHWSVLHCSRECTRIQGCLYPVFIHYKAGSYFLKQNKDLVWLSGSISFNSLHSGVNLLFFLPDFAFTTQMVFTDIVDQKTNISAQVLHLLAFEASQRFFKHTVAFFTVTRDICVPFSLQEQ